MHVCKRGKREKREERVIEGKLDDSCILFNDVSERSGGDTTFVCVFLLVHFICIYIFLFYLFLSVFLFIYLVAMQNNSWLYEGGFAGYYRNTHQLSAGDLREPLGSVNPEDLIGKEGRSQGLKY